MKLKPIDPMEGVGEWFLRFALFPVTLDDGNRVLWESYEQAELIDVSMGSRRTKMATREAGSDFMPWWAIEGQPAPREPIRRVERFDH